jgi:autotransporter-associated beta strand protein
MGSAFCVCVLPARLSDKTSRRMQEDARWKRAPPCYSAKLCAFAPFAREHSSHPKFKKPKSNISSEFPRQPGALGVAHRTSFPGPSATPSLGSSVSAILGGTSIALAKTTGGTITLSGANTDTGATSITAGTLLVNNTTGSGTGTNTVTVASGATLGGTGTISGATVKVRSA